MAYFKNDNTTAKLGEEKFIEFMNYANYQYLDVRNNKTWQHFDVDFIITGQNGKEKEWMLVDVKTASCDGGANLVEIVANDEKGVKGWLYTSLSQKIVYFKKTMNQLHFVDMLKLRELIDKKGYKFPHYRGETTGSDGKHWYYSDNLRVWYSDLIESGSLWGVVSTANNSFVAQDVNILLQ